MKKIVSLLLLGLMLVFAVSASADSSGWNEWNISEGTDEFDEPTGEYNFSYLFNNGTFSNSATTDSDLLGGLTIVLDRPDDDPIIALALMEYGSHIVCNYSSRNSESYTVSLMDSEKNKYTMNAVIPPNEQLMLFLDDTSFTFNDLLDTFKKGGTVKFVVTSDEHSLDKYKFSIDASSFNAAYEKYLELL